MTLPETAGEAHPRRAERPRSVRRVWGRGLSLILFGLLLGVLLSELLLRIVRPVPADELLPLKYKQDRLRLLSEGATYVQFDSELGWVSTPNTTRRGTPITYQNNRAGLRATREYAVDPPAGTRRLAAFGESFTYCQESNLADCWTDQLEHLLPRTEVLNYGVPGYGPDQALLRYEREGQAYRPCAVLIGFMDENVNRTVSRFFPFYQPETGLVAGKPRFVIRGGGLDLLPNPVTDPRQLQDPRWVEAVFGPDDAWYYPHLFTPAPLDSLKLYQVSRSALYRSGRADASIQRMLASYRDRDEAFQLSELILARFITEVRANGATPIVLLFSPSSELDAALHGRQFAHAPLVDWLRGIGVSIIDLGPSLVAAAQSEGLDTIAQFHYRPRGNAVVSRTLAGALPELMAPTCNDPVHVEDPVQR